MSADRLAEHRRQQAPDLLRLARTCLKSGDPAQGRALLLKAVEYDRDLADAWVWLTATTNDPAEQKQYLEWAIAAEPGHAQARRGLALLTGRLQARDVLPEGVGALPEAAPAPAPATPRRTYACPQCGGSLRFAPELVDLQCAACGYVEVVTEVPLADGAHPLDFTLPTARGHRWAVDERRFLCGQCGAASILPAGARSAVCPFCGQPALAAAADEASLVPPDGLIPMGLEAAAAQAAAHRWLGRGFFAPDDLNRLVQDRALRPAYVPVWIFEADLSMAWTAEVAEGYGRQRRWTPQNGDYSFFFKQQLQPAARVLPAALLRRLPPFDLQRLVVFKPEYLADWPAALYDISLADAALEARAAMTEAARRQARVKILPGRETRNFELAAGRFSGELYQLALLPFWLGAYTYRGRPYRLLVNGQTGGVAGDKPVDAVKVGLAAASALLLLALVVYLFWRWLAG